MEYKVNYLDIIPRAYLNEKIYIDSLSLYMRNSWTMDTRVDIYYNIFLNVLKQSVNLMNGMNVAYCRDNDSEAYVAGGTNDYWKLTGALQKDTSNWFLDSVGNLYGISRYGNLEDSTDPLSNVAFYYYILFRIGTNQYDGTMESLLGFYTGKKDIDPDSYEEDYWDYHTVYPTALSDFDILWQSAPNGDSLSLRALLKDASQYDSDIIIMFQEGIYRLNIAGVAIEYYFSTNYDYSFLADDGYVDSTDTATEDETTEVTGSNYVFVLSTSVRTQLSILAPDDYAF